MSVLEQFHLAHSYGNSNFDISSESLNDCRSVLVVKPGMLHRSAIEPNFSLVFIRIIMPYVSFCVSQGDRGFDGLPGLPGDKGHRVSEKKNSIPKAAYTSYSISCSSSIKSKK